MQRRRQASVAGVAALAGGALVVAAVVAAGPSRPRAAEPASAITTRSAEPVVPVVLTDCWVPDGGATIALTLVEAKELTTVAARARRSGGSTTVRAAVSRALDLSPAQSATLAASLLGDPGTERLTCSPARLDVDPEFAGPSGLTPRARALRRAWTSVFGPLPAGGFARGGVSSGHVDSSSHYDGRAIDVFFRPYDDAAQQRAGRVFAQWLVAHAQDHGILSVIYADRIWTSWAAYAGWRDYVHPSGNTTNPVLRHLDHVHVAVESGRPYRRP